MNIAFVGLGVMGFHMAGHLANAEHSVRVYNRTDAKSREWGKRFKGKVSGSPAEASSGADVALVCVGDDPDVEEVTFGADGILEELKPGSVLVDHTTTSAHLARKVWSACNAKQMGFIDAPVSGGEAGAINGNLSVMCGGEESHFVKVEPILDAYAQSVKLLGPSGSGQLAKMVNQVCIAGVIQGLSEAMSLGTQAGLNMEDVIEVISKGAAQSWQMENRAKTMLNGEYEFGFAVDLMRKDLRICLEQAEQLGVTLPITSLVDQYYKDVQTAGGGRWDTSSLYYRQLSSNSG